MFIARYANLSITAPIVIVSAPAHPLFPGLSPSRSRASATPNTIAVSRRAATGATGARVMAHNTSA
jgi:hypothetical protein